MYKLKTSDYDVEVLKSEGVLQKVPYKFKQSLQTLATHPDLKLNGYELVERHALVKKIVENKEEYILLEDNDFQTLKKAVLDYRGFGDNDVEFCRRFIEAEKVEVAEKTKKG